jgi:uncharacterized membrane protein
VGEVLVALETERSRSEGAVMRSLVVAAMLSMAFLANVKQSSRPLTESFMLKYMRMGNKRIKVVWWIIIVLTVFTFVGLFVTAFDPRYAQKATHAVARDGPRASASSWAASRATGFSPAVMRWWSMCRIGAAARSMRTATASASRSMPGRCRCCGDQSIFRQSVKRFAVRKCDYARN